MEKISKKEAIQALSEHYKIPIQTVVGWIKAFQKLKERQTERRTKQPLPWQEKLEATEKNAIEFLGECFRIGGADIVKIDDLETNLGPVAFREAERFAELMNWINPRPHGESERHGECVITIEGLGELKRVLRFSG